MIYHIAICQDWEDTSEAYRASSLQTEGFIHCSSAAQVVRVANAFYRDVPDLVLLCIDEAKLAARLVWEAPVHPDGRPPTPDESAERFPHVYGAINREAVVRVVAFPQDSDGLFALPPDLPV